MKFNISKVLKILTGRDFNAKDLFTNDDVVDNNLSDGRSKRMVVSKNNFFYNDLSSLIMIEVLINEDGLTRLLLYAFRFGSGLIIIKLTQLFEISRLFERILKKFS